MSSATGLAPATVSNIALLASLRYPVAMWPAGAVQCLKRINWLLANGRRRGIAAGVLRIPAEIKRYRQYRRRLPAGAVRSYWSLRRHPLPAAWPVHTEAA